MPSARPSAAMARVSADTAPLLAEYTARCGRPVVGRAEDMFAAAACADSRR